MAIDFTLGDKLSALAPGKHDPAGARRFGALRGLGRKMSGGDPRMVRQAATQMLSQIFFAPMLAEMRQSTLGDKFAGGGLMGGAMAEQLDMRVADAAAAGDPGGLVHLLEQKLGGSKHQRAEDALLALNPARARHLLGIRATAAPRRPPGAPGRGAWPSGRLEPFGRSGSAHARATPRPLPETSRFEDRPHDAAAAGAQFDPNTQRYDADAPRSAIRHRVATDGAAQ